MPNVAGITFSADGSRIAVIGGLPLSNDHTMQCGLYDYPWLELLLDMDLVLKTRFSRDERRHLPSLPIESVAFDADRGTFIVPQGDGSIAFLDPSTGEEASVLHAHDDIVSTVQCRPRDGLLVTGSWDGTAKLWTTREAS
jgi:WD40 repeat protein